MATVLGLCLPATRLSLAGIPGAAKALFIPQEGSEAAVALDLIAPDVRGSKVPPFTRTASGLRNGVIDVPHGVVCIEAESTGCLVAKATLPI